MCEEGYRPLEKYQQWPRVPELPWSPEGTPCREAYNGAWNLAWFQFQEAVAAECADPNDPACVLKECADAKYLVYVAAVVAAQEEYIKCMNPENKQAKR